MRSVVFVCLISIVIAAPNGGYNYITPNNYNFVSTGGSAPHQHLNVIQQQQHHFGGFNAPTTQQYFTNHATQSIHPTTIPQINYNSGFNTAPVLPIFNKQFNNYQHHQLQQQQHHGQRQILPPIVSKHIYIHSAPEEPDEDIYEDNSIQQQRKHYNIVFIKAPTQTVHKTALHVANALNEQKTIIYVLSKKNDVSEIKQALQNVPHQPQKPEVFFIKYRTPEEAQHAQNTIQAQYDVLGGTTKISDEGYAPVSSVIGAFGHHNNGGIVESGHAQLISSGSGISSGNGGFIGRGISSGSGNLLVNGSPSTYLPPNKIKK